MEATLASDPPLAKEDWIRMQGWYCDVEEIPPPPARVNIDQMTAERIALYWSVPLPGADHSSGADTITG